MNNKIKELMQRREQIGFELIEASGRKLKALNIELLSIEYDLEYYTGKTIKELEILYYKGEY